MVTCRILTVILIISFTGFRESTGLSCYECSDTFKRIWEPKDCQTNVTDVPVRQCNSQQNYCLVRKVTVKGIVTEITRDCTEDCSYGCEATSFGITRMTCVSCCNEDKCNNGSTGNRIAPYLSSSHLFISAGVQILYRSIWILSWSRH